MNQVEPHRFHLGLIQPALFAAPQIPKHEILAEIAEFEAEAALEAQHRQRRVYSSHDVSIFLSTLFHFGGWDTQSMFVDDMSYPSFAAMFC